MLFLLMTRLVSARFSIIEDLTIVALLDSTSEFFLTFSFTIWVNLDPVISEFLRSLVWEEVGWPWQGLMLSWLFCSRGIGSKPITRAVFEAFLAKFCVLFPETIPAMLPGLFGMLSGMCGAALLSIPRLS
jgi:hypothetical protein